jgi:hypothetical protein
MTEKIRDKAGLVFFNCPHFKHLRENDTTSSSLANKKKDEIEDLTTRGRLTAKTLNKKAEEYEEDEKKLKQKRKGKKNDPSIKEIKERLRKIIKYHEKQVKEMIPSIYPLLGPANSDSDESEGEKSFKRDEKKSHTKKEMKFSNK